MKFSDYDSQPLKSSRTTTYDSRGGVNVIKVGPGFLHSVTFSQADAAPTGGAITIYDMNATSVYGTVATIMFLHTQTTAAFMPQTVILDIPFVTGLAVGHDTAVNDVGVVVSYK